MSTVQILKGAEPWGAQGDNIGVLVVHGFTGSPQSVRYWAEAIAAEGRTVSVPRLPGHGTSLADFGRSTAAEWVAEAEMHLDGLAERCDRLFVCGLSMGGTITLDLAERFPGRFAGIVVVNAPILRTDSREVLAPVLGRLPLFLKGVANDVADPSQRELAYPKVSTRAAASYIAFREKVRARLGDISCPVLVMKSKQDHVVPQANAHAVFDNVGTDDKQLIWLEKSYHVATIDYDKDIIAEHSNRFIKERTS
jgi:carboxylesterase